MLLFAFFSGSHSRVNYTSIQMLWKDGSIGGSFSTQKLEG